ncbi:HvfC/BufC N-terminal domain-containing protein [Veronia nyctiphanis]|nr:DNA-binding domain-containing protein [Veronia nyctiphanis]
MSSLAILQRAFSQALHYQDHDLPAIKGRRDAEELLQIYRNQFVVSLTESLGLIYPTVNALVGEECFQAVARHHVLTTPMENARVETYGEGFDTTIESLSNISEPIPYLADVATFEWQFLDVSQRSVPSDAFPFDAIGQLSPEEVASVRLSLADNIDWHKSQYCIRSLWEAVKNQDSNAFDSLNLTQSEHTLLKKTHAGIELKPLSDDATRFIELSQQFSLGDLPPELVPQLVPLVEAGVFSHFSLN